MKTFQSTMGLFILAVFVFTGQSAHAIDGCLNYNNVDFADTDVPAAHEGVCIKNTEDAIFTFTGDVGSRPFNGYGIDVSDSSVNNDIIIEDGVTVTGDEIGIFGQDSNNYFISGEVNGGDIGIHVHNGNDITIEGGTITAISVIPDEGIGIFGENDNDIIFDDGTIIASTTGIDVLDDNIVTLGEDASIIAGVVGIWVYEGNEVTVDGTVTAGGGYGPPELHTGIIGFFGNTITLGETGLIDASIGIGVVDDNDITVNGEIEAGVVGIFGWDDNDITLGEGATIDAGLVGISVFGQEDFGNDITVNGIITAANDFAFATYGIDGNSHNTIILGETGEIHSTYGIIAGDLNTVTVNGEIHAGITGIDVFDDNVIEVGVGGSIAAGDIGILGLDYNTITIDGAVSAETYGVDVLNGNSITVGEFGEITAAGNGINSVFDSTIIVNGIITAGDTAIIVDSFGIVTIGETAIITSDTIGISAVFDNTVEVNGEINALVGIDVDAENEIVTLGETGIINADLTGIQAYGNNIITVAGEINAGGIGVQAYSGNIIYVDGEIDADLGVAVELGNEVHVGETGVITGNIGIRAVSGNPLHVSGEINVTTVAAIEGDSDDDSADERSAIGILAVDDNTVIIHETATITSEHTGIILLQENVASIAGSIDAAHTGVLLFDRNILVIEETGSVQGGVVGIEVTELYIEADTLFNTIHNKGLIEATGLTETTPGCLISDDVDPLNCHSIEAGTIYGVHNVGDADLWLINEGTIRALDAEDGSYVAFAIHDGPGASVIVNLPGGVIEGDIHTGGHADRIVLMAGSTTDGNIDMGVTPATIVVDEISQSMNSEDSDFGVELESYPDGIPDFDVDSDGVATDLDPAPNPNFAVGTSDILVPVEDDPLTTVDESAGGTLYQRVVGTDGSVDILYLSDAIIDLDVVEDSQAFFDSPELAEWDTSIDGVFNGDVTEAELLIKIGEAKWSLGGNVNIDGAVRFDDDGTVWTEATTVMGGRLDINGTLTSPNVIVWGGATLGGNGTIVTDPGSPGGNGGVILSGAIRDSDLTFGVAPTDELDRAEFLELNGLPENYVDEIFVDVALAPIDFNTLGSAPQYAHLSPGNSIGTLNVVGTVYLADTETAFTTYLVSGPADKETQDLLGVAYSPPDGIDDFTCLLEVCTVTTVGVDLITQLEDGTTNLAVPDGTNDFILGDDLTTLEVTELQYDVIYNDLPIEGREVVTNWGSSFDAELDQDGNHDLLNVTMSGATSAVVATVHEAHDDSHAGHDQPHSTYATVDVPDGVVFLGGRLDIQLEPGEYNDSHVMDIIIAEGGVDGVFQDVGFDGGPNDGAILEGYDLDGLPIRHQVFKGYLQYMPDRVRITSIPDFETHAETDNQTSIGHYIDGMTLFGLHQDPLQGAFAALGQVGDIPLALDWMTAEFFDPYNRVALTLAHGVVDTILDRVYQTHRGVATNLTSVGNGYGQDTSVGASGNGNQFVFWAGGNWNSSDVSSDEGHIEYDYDTLVGYVGAEYLFDGSGMLGLVASFGNTDLDYDASSASGGDVDHWSISGYGSYFISENAHVTAGGGHGSMDIETTREDAMGQVTEADYDGDYTFFFAEVSSTYNVVGDWKLTPSVDLTSTKVKQDGFSETGASPFALEVDSQSNKSLRGAVRARLAHEWEKDMGHLLAYLSVGVAHEFKDGNHVLQARFVGDSGNFTTWGQGFKGTTALVGVGMTAIINDTWAIEAHYNGEFGSNYDNHGISLNVNASF